MAFIPKQRTTITNVLNLKKSAKTSTAHTCAREMTPAHEDVCPKQKLPCMECKLLVPRDGIQNHHDFMCVNSPVQCPLECGTLLPRYVDNSQFWPEKSISRNNMIWFMRAMRGFHLFSRDLNYTTCKIGDLRKNLFYVFNAFLSQSIKIRWSE